MQFCFLSKKLNISKTSSLCSSCSLRKFELWYFLWKIFYAKPYFCNDLINKTNLYNFQLYLRPRRKAWVARPLAIVKVLQQKYRLNGFRQVEHKMVREKTPMSRQLGCQFFFSLYNSLKLSFFKALFKSNPFTDSEKVWIEKNLKEGGGIRYDKCPLGLTCYRP